MILSRDYIFSGLIILLYSVGIVGIAFFPEMKLEKISWINLLITSVFWFIASFSFSFLKYSSVVFLGAMLLEIIGVNTGIPFGEYYYENNLGFKIFGTPLIIGLNWLVLVSSVSFFAGKLFNNIWIKVLFSATFIVAIDFLIEPVAIKLHFWQWKTNGIPLQNYVTWWVVSSVFSYVYFRLNIKINNKVSFVLLSCIIAFFLLLNLL